MPGRWRLALGPFTQHLHDKPEYEYVWSVAIERQRDDGWMYGASYFSNSFGQACGYLYVGEQVTQLFEVRELFFQWSAGLIYGYKGEYSQPRAAQQRGLRAGRRALAGLAVRSRTSARRSTRSAPRDSCCNCRTR